MNLSKGQLALVLHAHLPFVRSAETGSLEEDWFFQALMECYLPILNVLEKANKSKNQVPRITIGISPTLLSLLSDREITQRFIPWLEIRLDLLAEVKGSQRIAANYLAKKIKEQLNLWKSFEGDLIGAFVRLQKVGVVDLLTCAATHGYLPLLRDQPEAVKSQLFTAVREHKRLIGSNPLGIWLPECAYYEGLDQIMHEAGLRYAVLDGHGLLHARPRPLYGLYAPICTRNGVAFFGRDSDATLPVWSAMHGYPGNPVYREFHRDLGWELSNEDLKKIGISNPRPLGLKLFKVTDRTLPLEKKEIYNPDDALSRVKEHATDYLKGRRDQLDQLSSAMDLDALLVAPFDAELFGHWWFEGPQFLSELFRQAKKEKISFVRLIDTLSISPELQLCEPCPSSWGQGGYHHYWLNESNAWVVPEWNRASRAMVHCCTNKSRDKSKDRLLKQAARELLLAQSSDWSFILRAGTTTQLAKERIDRHLNRFWSLINVINDQAAFSESQLSSFEQEDSIFPLVDPRDWEKISS